MNGRDLILCRKNDSIMTLLGNNNSPDDVYLAPRDFGGYVILINTAFRTQRNNCKSHLRIIVFASKAIRPGDQLLYKYGRNFKYIASRLI